MAEDDEEAEISKCAVGEAVRGDQTSAFFFQANLLFPSIIDHRRDIYHLVSEFAQSILQKQSQSPIISHVINYR